jgi:hypothetical protein
MLFRMYIFRCIHSQGVCTDVSKIFLGVKLSGSLFIHTVSVADEVIAIAII